MDDDFGPHGTNSAKPGVSWTTLACATATAAVLLAGCASEQELSSAARLRSDTDAADLDRQSVCCERLGDVRYTMLSSARTSLDLEPGNALVRSFDTGNSYFLAVEVPPSQGQASIGLRSDMVGGGRGSLATVFVPSVMMLDRDFKPVGTVGELPLCFDRGWTRDNVGYFSTLSVDAANVRYLVFFTDRRNRTRSVGYSSSATTAGGGVALTQAVNYQLPRSPSGHLDVWLDSPAAANASAVPACARHQPVAR